MTEVVELVSDCMCEWDSACSGTGVIYCDGCGGDQCVCICGGEADCPGCEACEGSEGPEDEENGDAALRVGSGT